MLSGDWSQNYCGQAHLGFPSQCSGVFPEGFFLRKKNHISVPFKMTFSIGTYKAPSQNTLPPGPDGYFDVKGE